MTRAECSVEGCERDSYCHTFCVMHYSRYVRDGDPGEPQPRYIRGSGGYCTIDGCFRKVARRGLCFAHHEEERGKRDVPRCEVGGCERPVLSKGLCNMHGQRVRAGKPVGPPIRQVRPKAQVGEERQDKQGYIKQYEPGHPNSHKNGWIQQHRLVMSKLLGRPLMDHEVPHHRNGIRSDNRPENLELWSRAHPAGQRIADLLDFAHMILDVYGSLSPETTHSPFRIDEFPAA